MSSSDIQLDSSKTSNIIREIVLNSREPIILRNFATNWECFQCTLKEWCQKYDAATNNAPNLFERANLMSSMEPQFERKREAVNLTAMQFLQDHKNKERNYWTGLNYKRVQELPDACKKGIDFSIFGFDNATEDSSFWLSSEGANTPCHYDTYGCNIVIQIYGRKSWLLFPPNAQLTTTRIPYEESSVYCTQNFYAPNAQQFSEFLKLKNCAFRCILEPNDVLIVPRKWWHFVETLEISLSVNSWIPLIDDVDAQLDECIVKFLIEKVINGVNYEQVKYILNPNQLNQIIEEPELLKIFQYLMSSLVSVDSATTEIMKQRYSYHYMTTKDFSSFLSSIQLNFCQVQPFPLVDFKELLMENAKRYAAGDWNQSNSPIDPLKEILVNSICSPNVIKTIKKELLERYENSFVQN